MFQQGAGDARSGFKGYVWLGTQVLCVASIHWMLGVSHDAQAGLAGSHSAGFDLRWKGPWSGSFLPSFSAIARPASKEVLQKETRVSKNDEKMMGLAFFSTPKIRLL